MLNLKKLITYVTTKEPVYGNGYSGETKSLLPGLVGFGGISLFILIGGCISVLDIFISNNMSTVGLYVMVGGMFGSAIASAIIETIE